MLYSKILVACSVCLLIAGCGGGPNDLPELGQVQGTITNNKKPVVNATVTFQPEKGSPSYATTDDAGKYTLAYSNDNAGAQIGSHKVRVTIGAAAKASTEGEEETVSEKEPEEHQISAPVTVKEGENTFDFDLADQ